MYLQLVYFHNYSYLVDLELNPLGWVEHLGLYARLLDTRLFQFGYVIDDEYHGAYTHSILLPLCLLRYPLAPD
jgi:hypothetical protein